MADFGLTEKTYSQNYFRQGIDSKVKLPIKWMAPESMSDGLFTEATDVVITLLVSIINLKCYI